MKKLFENWRKHLNEDWQRGEEDKESEDRRAQQIAQKYGLPDEPGLYGAEAVMLSDDQFRDTMFESHLLVGMIAAWILYIDNANLKNERWNLRENYIRMFDNGRQDDRT